MRGPLVAYASRRRMAENSASLEFSSAQSTARYAPIAPLILFVGLSGCRFGEAIDLTWDRVDLDALDATGKAVREIYIDSSSKTAKARTIGLEVSPTLRKLLAAQRMKTGGKGSVFGPSRDADRRRSRASDRIDRWPRSASRCGLGTQADCPIMARERHIPWCSAQPSHPPQVNNYVWPSPAR
jgi:integrase